jgi:hypothetical protein
MVTLARRVNHTPLAPVVGVMFGLVAAILVAATPAWMFDKLVTQSGLPSILSFAAPPLGLTARVFAMALAAIVVGGGLWLVVGLIEKALSPSKPAAFNGQPALWHDLGYTDAEQPVKLEGRRRPIFAPAELGAPLMSDEAIAGVQPLSILTAEAPADAPAHTLVDATADETRDETSGPAMAPVIEPAPLSSLRPVATPLPELAPEPELEVPLTAAEFDLPPSDSPEDDDDSIQSLIRRLESGLARRAANDPGPDSPTSAPPPLTLSRDWIIPDNASFDHPADEGDHDIQQALGTLQKFASR